MADAQLNNAIMIAKDGSRRVIRPQLIGIGGFPDVSVGGCETSALPLMIELIAQDGSRLAVEPAVVWHVRAANQEQAAIYVADGAALFVMEACQELIRRFNAGEWS
ncbi:hypothetical protein ACMGDM_02015 [Sphingomonas sp. DT-51]|uniref:hypothetical protein n=1 Tax=Sphingomonas sp. DT-51 TaxID=3396165 RepID=UPI003F1BB892